MLKRGGIAAGNPNNPAIPTGTTFSPFPPQSTYLGPTIAGSESNFILVVVLSGLAFFGATGLGYWLVRRRLRRNHPARRRSKSSIRIGHNGPLGSKKGWQKMHGDGPDEEEDLGRIYGNDAFEMDYEPGGSMVSLELHPDNSSSPPDYQNPPDNRRTTSKLNPEALHTSAYHLDPASPSLPVYQQVMKHRSPSPSPPDT